MPFVSQSLRYSMPPQVRGSITCASISASAPTTLDLSIMSRVEIPKDLTVTKTGSGAVTWGYKVAALGPGGKTTAATAEVTVASQGAVLSTSVYNTISWMECEGAEGYAVYRTTASGGTPSTTGLIKLLGPDCNSATAGYCTMNDTGLAIINAAAAPSSDTSYVLNQELPHYIYIENTGSNPMYVTFVKAPNATVADDKAELVIEESVSDTVFTRRFAIAALGNRMFSAAHGMKWLSMEGNGGATSAYIELA